ncbi:ABC transporter permease [Thermocatellispora tengchongensis]
MWLSAAWIGLVALSALLAPLLPLPDPTVPDYEHIASGPVTGHLLGTDQLGRDMLARLIHGARASLQVGLVAVLLGLSAGMLLGLLAGYLRGWVDAVISAVVDLVLAFPALVFIMVLVAVRGATATVLIIGLGSVFVPTFTRLARANTLMWSKREFVLASRVLGSGRLRTLAREVFPNVLPSVLAYAFVVVAVVMVAEGSLSFLGFGLQPPTPSWGSMIAGGRQLLSSSPHIVALPALVLLLTVLSFNVIGDRLRNKTSGRSEVSL